MLKRIKIGRKLIGGFLIVATIGAVIGIIGIYNIADIGKDNVFLYEKAVLPSEYLGTIAASFHRQRINLLQALRTTDPEKTRYYTDRVESVFEKTINEKILAYRTLLGNVSGESLFGKFVSVKAKTDVVRNSIEKLIIENRKKDAEIMMDGEFTRLIDEQKVMIDKMIEENVKNARETSEGNTVLVRRSVFAMTVITVLGALMAVFLGFLISRSLTKPIRKITEASKRMAKGDLNVNLEVNNEMNCSRIKKCGIAHCRSYNKTTYCWLESGSYSANPDCNLVLKGGSCDTCVVYLKSSRNEIEEMSTAYNNMVGHLRHKSAIIENIGKGDFSGNIRVVSGDDIIGSSLINAAESINNLLAQVKYSVDMVTGGAGQVSSASQQLSQGATEQASSMEEITSSITQITSQTKMNSENAVMVNGLAKEASLKAEQGNQRMKDLVSAMEEINTSADGIKKIVKTIDDIAFQINLLALNANVEAARAGKYGKGFAVVAEEVRNLAVRSANSVKETNQMVEEAIRAIENGSQLVDVTSKDLTEIVDGASKVAVIASEVATASREQTQGLTQISEGLGQIDQVTQQNTASAEECASASQELASQAERLKNMISRFKLRERMVTEEENVSEDMVRRIRKELTRELMADNLKQGNILRLDKRESQLEVS